MGFDALHSITTGGDNTAVGWQALYSDPIGFFNTAVGSQALFSYNNPDGPADPFGGRNTAIGYQALYSNVVAGRNTATGFRALHNNRGHFNTATGDDALYNNTSGENNIALGVEAGINLTTGGGNIDIGNDGVADEANTIRIGTQGAQTRTFIAGIHGTALGSGLAVRVNANGRLGTAPSSERFKQNIKPIDKASEAIFALKPVTFRYKPDLDPEGIPQFGLVAEEVEKVNPDLVARDREGKPYTVRYEGVNAMLLNEFIKEHKKVEEQQSKIDNQQASIAELKATVAQQAKGMDVWTAQLKEQAAQIQKVSAQFEVSKTTPQMVLNNQ